MYFLGILCQYAFCDFYMEEIAGQTIFFSHIFYYREDIHIVKIVFGQVKRNRRNGQVFIQALTQHPADFLQYIRIQAMDQTDLFQNRDERSRRQKADLGVDPAGQGFHAT